MNGGHIYEVIRFEQGVAIFLQEHLDRLYSSAQKSGIKINIGKTEIYDKYNAEGFDKDKIINMRIEVSDNKYEIRFAKPIEVNKQMYEHGVNVVTIMQKRKDPNVKSTDQSYYSSYSDAHYGEDIFEFILFDNGILKEGTRSNFFAVKKDTIFTPDSKNVLMGVTRTKVFMLAEELGIKISHDDIFIDEISNMDAFFITGTSIGVMPVKQINNKQYASAKDETVFKLRIAYDEYVRDYIRSNQT